MAQPKPCEVFPSQTGNSQGGSFFSALFQTGFEPNTCASKPPAPGTTNDSSQAPDAAPPGADNAVDGSSCPLDLSLLFEQPTAQLRSAPGPGGFSTKANSPDGIACAPADSRKWRSGTAPVRLSSLTPKILTVMPLATTAAPSNAEPMTTSPAPAAPWNFDPAAQLSLRSVVSNDSSTTSLAANAPSAATMAMPETAPGAGAASSAEATAPQSLAAENSQVAAPGFPLLITGTASMPSGQRTPETLPATNAGSGSATKLFASPLNGDGGQSAPGISRNANGVDLRPSSPAAAPNGIDGVEVRTLQAAHAGFEFARVELDGAADGLAASAAVISKSAIPNEAVKPALRAEPIPSSGAPFPTVPAQAAAAVVHPTSPDLHPSAQPQTAGGQAAPTATVAASVKSQPKDNSNGSENGDSDKPGRSSGTPAVHVDSNGFNQSVEPANSNTGAPNPAAALPAAPVVDPRVPPEARASSGGEIPPSKEGAAPPSGSQSLPSAPGADQPVVSAAQLMGRSGQAEIHIEMQAGPLGAVDLRARVSGDQVGASIAVEHRDAQLMLSNELPMLHVALAEKNLRVNSLSVSQGMGASTGGGLGSSPGQKESTPFHPRQIYATENEITAPASEAQLGLLERPLPGMRLSIRA